MEKILSFLSLFWNKWAIVLIIVTILFLCSFVLLLICKSKKRIKLESRFVLVAGVGISVFVMVFPFYYVDYGFNAFLPSLYHSLQSFIMNCGGIVDLLSQMSELKAPYESTPFAEAVYAIFGGFLYVLAPAVTASFLLLLLKNFRTWLKYIFSFNKQIHIFSELNEKSLALANSIFESDGGYKQQIVFADIIDKSEEQHMDLVDGAQKINAIFFKKDLTLINLTKQKHKIYLISDDENEKIKQADELIEKLKNDENKGLYIFSNSNECECLMNSFSNNEKRTFKMQIELINDVRFLIYNYLEERGINFFINAKQRGNKDLKEISVAVVGLGRYGSETVKALLWYCQLPGFKINITAFDKDKNAKSKAQAMFPGLELDKDFTSENNIRYRFSVIDNIDIGTSYFKDVFNAQEFDHVFVMLGDDSENISASTKIRRYLEQNNHSDTEISTVIYNSTLNSKINKKSDIRGNESTSKTEKLKIYAFGCIDEFYSTKTLNSKLIDEDGLEIHRIWDKQSKSNNTYYMDTYNFYSSIAKALHYRLRNNIIQCNNKENFPKLFEQNRINYIIQATTSVNKASVCREKYTKCIDNLQLDKSKTVKELRSDKNTQKLEICNPELDIYSIEDVLNIAEAATKIDHIRWNAYMYTEGFVKGKKEDIYRKHHNLVPADETNIETGINDI